MAQVIELDDMQDGYISLIETVLRDGDEVSPRGMKTREVLGTSVVLHNPALSVPVGVGRKPNLAIGAGEAAQLIAGASDAAMMVNVAKNFASFVEYDRFYGAYGPRIFQQMPMVIRTLTADVDTRQAGVVIWRPDDIALGTKDVPCTLELHFLIRNDKLHMITSMRSNDCVWGVTYDFWQFTALQHAVAWAIGVPVGTYTHNAFSLHVYVDRDMGLIEQLHKYDGTEHPPMSTTPPKDMGGMDTDGALRRWTEVRKRMEAAIGIRAWSPSYDSDHRLAPAKWYASTLGGFASEGKLCRTCRYVLPSSYFDSNDKPRCRWCKRDNSFGLPAGTVSKMLLAQGGACAVCGDKLNRFHLDHDHSTGVPRGLLCSNHNTGLGLFGDSSETLRSAAAYVERHEEAYPWDTDYNFLYRTRP